MVIGAVTAHGAVAVSLGNQLGQVPLPPVARFSGCHPLPGSGPPQVVAANPKLANVDLSKLLTPAATLRCATWLRLLGLSWHACCLFAVPARAELSHPGSATWFAHTTASPALAPQAGRRSDVRAEAGPRPGDWAGQQADPGEPWFLSWRVAGEPAAAGHAAHSLRHMACIQAVACAEVACTSIIPHPCCCSAVPCRSARRHCLTPPATRSRRRCMPRCGCSTRTGALGWARLAAAINGVMVRGAGLPALARNNAGREGGSPNTAGPACSCSPFPRSLPSLLVPQRRGHHAEPRGDQAVWARGPAGGNHPHQAQRVCRRRV